MCDCKCEEKGSFNNPWVDSDIPLEYAKVGDFHRGNRGAKAQLRNGTPGNYWVKVAEDVTLWDKAWRAVNA